MAAPGMDAIRADRYLLASGRSQGKPLPEVIMTKCRERKIAAARVFRGLEGCGETIEIRSRHFTCGGEPLLSMAIDSAETIDPMIHAGPLASSPVELIRVKEHAHAGPAPVP
jgi:PII-like signaling protein